MTTWAWRVLSAASAVGTVALVVATARAEAGRLVPQSGQVTLVPLVGVALTLAGALSHPARQAVVVRIALVVAGIAWLLPSLVPGTERWHQAALVVAIGALPAPPKGSWLALTAAAAVPLLGIGGQAAVAVVFLAVALIAAARRSWLASAAAGLLGGGLGLAWAWSRADPAGWDPDRVLVAYEMLLLAVALLLGVPARVHGLQDRLVGAGTAGSAGMEGLVEVLRASLRDPTLQVRPASSAESVGGDGVEVRDDDRLLAVVSGRSRALGDPITRDAVASAVRLVALAEERRQALDRHTIALADARARLVAAVDAERATTAELLRDRVIAPIEATLGRLARVDSGESVGPALEQLVRSAEDIKATAIGLHPRALGDGGLSAALSELARRSPVPCSLEISPGAVAEAQVEAALFYVCSEALANAAKHAGARRIDVALRLVAGELELAVYDDGRGGVDPNGPGLHGLTDRLARAGGALRVESPPGAGTRLVASVPVSSSRSASTAGS